MNWFDLSPQSIAGRVREAGDSRPLPSLGCSVLRGAIGFTLLGLAGFAPWALGWRRQLGEPGMYTVCALVFVILSGPLLHRLILGPGSLAKFYRLFTFAFLVYAVVWCAAWFGVRFKGNDYLGLALGTAAFGWIVASAFGARDSALKCILALFLLHAIGYWAGGWLYTTYKARSMLEFVGVIMDAPTRSVTARLLWGFGYGLGFGAGIGCAFYFCQAEARTLITSNAKVQASTAA